MNKKAIILTVSLVFLWIFLVPIGIVGMALLGSLKEWKNGNGFVWPWVEQEASDDYSAIDWDHEFEKIVLKQDNTALREYYEGIHLCRVGYEKVTQPEIKQLKILLQN